MNLSNTYSRSNLTGSAFVAASPDRYRAHAAFRVGKQAIVASAPAYQPTRFAPVKFSAYVKPMLSRA